MIRILLLLLIIFLNLRFINAEGYIKASDGIEWDSLNKIYSAFGNVVFKNDNVEATSSKMIASYIEENEQEIFTIVEFFENISIYFKDEVFKGEYAIYEKDENLIKIYGNVSIESPTKLLTGDELIVDLNNNTRTLNSNKKETVVEVLIENENN